MLYISDFFLKNSYIGIGKLYFYAIQYYVSYNGIYKYIIILYYYVTHTYKNLNRRVHIIKYNIIITKDIQLYGHTAQY